MNNEQEIWKDIPNYEGIYAVSNLGRVKTYGRIDKLNRVWKEKFIKMCVDNYGYQRICLRKNDKLLKNKSSLFRVHRLVAQSFIPNPNNYSDVNHIDGVKTNNLYTNLEWTTKSQNVKDAWKNGLIGKPHTRFENHYNAKLNWEQVNSIRSMHKTGNYSQRQLKKMFNLGSHKTISDIIQYKTWNNIK